MNNHANGYGVFINKQKEKFQGYWKKDQPHGKGKETWKDGSLYEGEYLDGVKVGFGKYRMKNGDIYEG